MPRFRFYFRVKATGYEYTEVVTIQDEALSLAPRFRDAVVEERLRNWANDQLGIGYKQLALQDNPSVTTPAEEGVPMAP